MPMASMLLRPTVDLNQTPSLNEAGISQSQLIRFKDGLTQKYGGWEAYYPLPIGSTIKELHPWEGLSSVDYLGVGATQQLAVITAGSAQDITPQTTLRNFAPSFSVSSGSNVVTVEDPGSSATSFDVVYFNTPVAVGGILLNGAYQINTVGGSSSYTILANNISSVTVVTSGILPVFDVDANSPTITVTLPNNNFPMIPGLYQQFIAPTTVGGLLIEGSYQIASIIDSTSFTMNASVQSTATASGTMNSSLVQALYYITIGPSAAGTGYGIGGYGLGGYGTGVAGSTPATGTPITATNWSMDNWGEALLACPANGPIYVWSPHGGFTNASVIPNAPFFNGGIFISMPQQILVAWRSCQSTGVQDNLVVRWSDAANYNQWAVNSQTVAGSFRIPTGSKIIGGLQAPKYGVVWTDLDVWIMQYVGGVVTFNFTRVGTGCGLIAQHAAGILNGIVYWMGMNSFYVLGPSGQQSLPCSVWDFVFQNLNTNYLDRIICATNSLFNEIAWYFPSANSTGENDSYVKYTIGLGWDYGFLGRTAWYDTSIIGNPVGSDTTGMIWQHDITNDAGGVAMTPSFQTGWWSISDGNEMAFVDWVLPDMKWGTYSGAKTAAVQITFQAVDYPGDTPRTYGPYTFTQATDYINVRIRGRLLSARISSVDAGSFWRLGRIRYRWAPMGRR